MLHFHFFALNSGPMSFTCKCQQTPCCCLFLNQHPQSQPNSLSFHSPPVGSIAGIHHDPPGQPQSFPSSHMSFSLAQETDYLRRNKHSPALLEAVQILKCRF
ncbi:hypothetical protein C8Q75DRAFT_172536 [Abortiporus biennis]|nr:hypothetical protein C8Q75DRAFT_172536 [Abortiporus biennis]